jgi:hypothetical protein
MESSLIYSASRSLKHKVNWIKVSAETEWIYFGAQDEANKPIVVKSINEYFPDSTLYIALGRKDSRQADKCEIGEAIDNILGIQDFLIWEMGFKKVVEFNHIGVMRRGYV